MTAVAIGILVLYMTDLLAFIMIVKNEKRINRLESSEKVEEYTLKPCPFQYDCDKLVTKMWNKRIGEQNATD